MIDILNTHLNKYLIRIIREYNEIDIDKLVSKIPKEKIWCDNILKEDYTIEDLIIKSIINGFQGFYVHVKSELAQHYIKQCDLNINTTKFERESKIGFYFTKDERNLKIRYVDILALDIFNREIMIEKL